MYYLFLVIFTFYFIQYLETKTIGQVLWDGICLLLEFILGVILIIVFLFWIAHNG
jgi:hypothetical protein